MVDAVDEMLLVQRGKELGYTLSDEQFKQRRRQHQEGKQARDRRAVPGGAEAGEHDDGRPAAEPRALDDAGQRVQQNEVFGKIGVTDEEARKYYEAHLEEFTTPPTVTLREILVAVPGDREGAERRRRTTRRRRRPRRFARAHAGRRELREAGRRGLRRAVEGQRRPDRAAEHRTISRRDLRKLIEPMKPGDDHRAGAHARAATSS